MKTMISSPDSLFQSAKAQASRLKFSRGDLYEKAAESFVSAYGANAVTRRLNEVYAEQASAVPQDLQAAQTNLRACR